MRLYHVDDDYIEYLRQFDSRVYDNKNGTRPYVGVALTVAGTEYYIPMSSPKPKHDGMKNSVDFMKMADGQRKMGVLNLNCMIPVYSTVLMVIDIGAESDTKYRTLLYHQAAWIQSHAQRIQQNAVKLYRILMQDDGALRAHEHKLRERCCDLRLLEAKMKELQESRVTTCQSQLG